MSGASKRNKTRTVKVGPVSIGGGHPVVIQSMTKTRTSAIDKTVEQIHSLEKAGCQIVRLAIKDNDDAVALSRIKPQVRLPLVADIHFDWRLALRAIECGADKVRLNPGNIEKKEHIRQVIDAARGRGIPIRIGVNSGSVKHRASGSIAQAMAKSALRYIAFFERMKFTDIVLSLKASSVGDTVEAYRLISKLCRYPLHLGVTATGAPESGAIKTAIALGILLSEGIGDTIRVSLTDTPEREVRVAQDILEALGLRSFRPEIISCPTCGRCEVDLVSIVRDLEKRLSTVNGEQSTTKVAVMGCVVNGPGEAREADVGVAFGKKEGLLFRKGKPVRKIAPHQCAAALVKEAATR